MALEKISELENREFVLDKVRYRVISVRKVQGRDVVLTDKRTFTFFPTETADWLEKIEVVDLVAEQQQKDAALYEKTVGIKKEPDAVAVMQPKALPAEIIHSTSMTEKVSGKLFEMFEKLSDNPSEEDYKKATAMVNVSNAIVNAQVTQLKFLMLKK